MTDWKPGDIALVRNEWGVWNRAICAVRALSRDYVWSFGVSDCWVPVDKAQVRPLVVINPDDPEQVERLADLVNGRPESWGTQMMAAALREFAQPTPPKPDEPTGLGAVAEDTDGNIFVRVDRGGTTPWTFTGAVLFGEKGWRAWADIHAVRILSEGVTA